MNSIDVLRIRLHGQIAGYLISLSQGQNLFYFDSDYVMDEHRSTFSLTTHPNFPSHDQMLTMPWVRWQRLHPILSNLLPEGNLREFLARQFKIHPHPHRKPRAFRPGRNVAFSFLCMYLSLCIRDTDISTPDC